MGKPRYLPGSKTTFMPRIELRRCTIGWWVLGLKYREDLFLFTLWPEAQQYEWIMSEKISQLARVALRKKIESSAKKRWLTHAWAVSTNIDSMEQINLTNFPDHDRKHIIHKYGDKGSPWRIPLVGRKKGPGFPLTRTENETVSLVVMSTAIEASIWCKV